MKAWCQIPSSGSMVRVKFRRSSGFGKWVFIVLGSESSVKSGDVSRCQTSSEVQPFWTRIWAALIFGFLVATLLVPVQEDEPEMSTYLPQQHLSSYSISSTWWLFVLAEDAQKSTVVRWPVVGHLTSQVETKPCPTVATRKLAVIRSRVPPPVASYLT